MSDGKVLVIKNPSGGPSSASIFDPLGNSGSGSWKAAAKPVVPGSGESWAFLLTENCGGNCNKILQRFNSHPSSWAMYDADLDAWTETVAVQARNDGVAAGIVRGSPDQCAALCGAVIAVGGQTDTAGQNAPSQISEQTAEVFDPATSAWTLTAPPPGFRVGGASVSLEDGRILFIFPEFTGSPPMDPVADYFNAADASWTPAASPPSGIYRGGYTNGSLSPILLPNGKVMAFSKSGPKLFDPAANGGLGLWSDAPACSVCFGAAAKLPNGKVLIAGGASKEGPNSTTAAELFDPYANQGGGAFSPTGPLKTAGLRWTATPINGTRGQCGKICGTLMFAGQNNYQTPNLAGLPTEIFTPAPEIVSLAPTEGPVTGGTEVILTGSGLAGATQVSFGDLPALRFAPDRQNPDAKLLAVAPAHTPGSVPVTVTGAPGLAIGTARAPFTYKSPEVAPVAPQPPAIPAGGPSVPGTQSQVTNPPPGGPPPAPAAAGPPSPGGTSGLGAAGGSGPATSSPPVPPGLGSPVVSSSVTNATAGYGKAVAGSTVLIPAQGPAQVSVGMGLVAADSPQPAPKYNMVANPILGLGPGLVALLYLLVASVRRATIARNSVTPCLAI